MKKQRGTLIGLFLTALLVISGGLLSAEPGESIYGHISFVDKDATVIRLDNTEHKAVVNLPVAPGDQIVTGEKGRCELQFDNGTIIRLDKDSRLKVTTVLAPSLTSRWKVTTLHLMRGGLCSMNTRYDSEMFQIITPNAAFDLKKRATSFIHLKQNGDTFVYAERGKFKVMYGEDIHSLNTEIIRADKKYTITADHQLRVDEGKRDFDFVAWNEYINRNFKDLHFGVSKVPKKLYWHNKALVYWAEKWSSLFGEWVYDDIFGYVWKPADELFAFSERPFFHANFTRVNGELFIVPQQPWGWVPAHMGTWVWMKWGWTWVPGSAFSPGLCSSQFSRNWFYPTMGYWVNYCYGSYDLYYTYRDYGIRAWREEYQKTFSTYKKNPGLKKIPKSVRELIVRMNKAPIKAVKERLGSEPRLAGIGVTKVKPLLKSVTPTVNVNTDKPALSGSKTVKSGRIVRSEVITGRNFDPGSQAPESKTMDKIRNRMPLRNFRDWNPDSRWAANSGVKIVYSSRNNEVVCPNLGLYSRSISSVQRANLKASSRGYGGSRSTTGVISSSGTTNGSSTVNSTQSSSSGTRRGGGDSGSTRGSGTTKK